MTCTVATVNLTSLRWSLYFSVCIPPPLLGFLLTVSSSSSSALCSLSFSVSLSLDLCAPLSSDRSCWVFLLSHKVPSYGNHLKTDSQTCTRTRLLFTCHPVWTEATTFSCQAVCGICSLPQHCHVLRHKDRWQWGRKNRRVNDGQLLPDILATEINKDTPRVGGLMLFVFSRNLKSTAKNNYIVSEYLTSLLQCSNTTHADICAHQPCWSKYTQLTGGYPKNTSSKTRELIITLQLVIIIIFVHTDGTVSVWGQTSFLCVCSSCFSQSTFSSPLNRRLDLIEGLS